MNQGGCVIANDRADKREKRKEKREKRKISWQAASEDLLAIIHITHKPIARLEAFMVVKIQTKKRLT